MHVVVELKIYVQESMGLTQCMGNNRMLKNIKFLKAKGAM